MSKKRTCREFVRIPMCLKAYYYLDGDKEGLNICNVSNISYEGICINIYSRKKIKMGAGINLGLVYQWKPIAVKGVFIWTRKIGKCYVGGIELTKALDAFTMIKCYLGSTRRKEQEVHCNYFIRLISNIKEYFTKQNRNIKEISHMEKANCLIKDFKIEALGKLERLQDNLTCISNDFIKIQIALKGIKVDLIRLKHAEENLRKKIIVNEKYFGSIKTHQSFAHQNPTNKETTIIDIKEFKARQISTDLSSSITSNA